MAHPHHKNAFDAGAVNDPLATSFQQPADAKARTVQFPSGLLGGKAYPAGRYTFETRSLRGGLFKPDSPLLPSGLLGPVTLQTMGNNPGN